MNTTLPRNYGEEPCQQEPQIIALMSKLGDVLDRAMETQGLLVKRLGPILLPVDTRKDCEERPECSVSGLSPLAERVDFVIRRVTLLDETNQALISRLGV
jgi:hypothetical protein